jgi:hypothetical protein
LAFRLLSTGERVVKIADSCADGVKSASGPQGESAVILPPVSETEKRQWDLEELRKQGLARPRFEWQDQERLAVVENPAL